MTPVDEASERAMPPHGGARTVFRHDVLALAAAGLVIGLACRGHFAVPHPDFLDFLDTGHAWLRGELPASLKRAPVFPLLVVTVGKLLPTEAADLVVAEWLNALLLPLNGLLVYLIGRRWFGAGARWASLWFLLLPIGMYCTAHVIAEPLLAGLILLTILAAQRGGAWAYVAAAVATMTRYDAAAFILGVGVAELLRRGPGMEHSTHPRRRVLVRTALAATPLVVWLGLTAVTWTRHGNSDHYLAQIAEKPGFDLRWATSVVAQACFDRELLHLHAWRFFPDMLLVGTAVVVPLVLVLVGIVVMLGRRDAAAITAVVGGAGYVLVHTAFPFKETRFGYPLAPVFLLFVGAGLQTTCRWLRRLDLGGGATRILLVAIGLMLAWALIGEAQAFATATGGPDRLTGRLGLLGLVGITVIWAAPLVRRRRRLPQLVLLLALPVVLTTQLTSAAELLGTGQNMKNQVEAARWIAANTPPAARVLSGSPGLLRLYVGRDPRDRFIHFADIQGQTWEEIIAECRQRRIEYIIWHDQLFPEHGGYYAGKWRLSRFDPLARPDTAPGVQPVRWFKNWPNLVIVRVMPE